MKLKHILAMILLTGCAATERDCQSCNASSFGGDWLVLQYSASGAPINCWKLDNTAIDNEHNTDGIYWRDPSGHMIHISGWYNRVQVNNKNFADGAKALGIDLAKCTSGKYAP